jgi:hypothetical protein
MKVTYNNFLIVSTIALLMGGAYLYFSNNLNSDKMIPVAFGSSLSNTAGAEVIPADPTSDNKITSDISFLSALVSLKKIKIDGSLFTNSSFNNLKDNAVKIEKVVPGRVNPFAPMDTNSSGSGAVSLPKVVTNQPIGITSKTVILNGTVNVVDDGTTDTYFEYGSTLNLGTVTEMVKQSLVGTFVKNISGLVPKTTYYFKACLKINNVPSCGDIISFTTI